MLAEMTGNPKDIDPIANVTAAALRTASGTTSVNTLSPPALFLRGTFLDPIGGGARPLPPHTWFLSKAGEGAILFGSDSDSRGISTMQLVLGGDPKGRWVLSWRPILTSAAEVSSGDIWIDLDAVDPQSDATPRALLSTAWVTGSKAKEIERRRLVRLVVMDSKAKRATDGFEVLAGSGEPLGSPGKDFPTEDLGADGHVLELAFAYLLAKHATASRPWELQVDYNWFTTWIAFEYFDLASRTSLTLPPGIVVSAKDERGNLVGAGVSIDDAAPGEKKMSSTLVYVLQQRTQAQSADVQYTFELPEQSIVDLEGAILESDARTLKVGVDISDDLRMRYILPTQWHSHGMRAWTATAEVNPSIPVIEEWDDAATDEKDPIRSRVTTRTRPLHFHLDDTLLVDEHRGAGAVR